MTMAAETQPQRLTEDAAFWRWLDEAVKDGGGSPGTGVSFAGGWHAALRNSPDRAVLMDFVRWVDAVMPHPGEFHTPSSSQQERLAELRKAARAILEEAG